MVTTIVKTIKATGGDYVSLNAWWAAEQADLMSLDQIRVAEVYGGVNCLTDSLFMNYGAAVTDTTRYYIIRAASGHQHQGVYNEAKAYGKLTNKYCIKCQSLALLVQGMQFRSVDDTGPPETGVIHFAYGGYWDTIDQCLLLTEANGPNGGGICVYTAQATYLGKIYTIKNSLLACVGGAAAQHHYGIFIQSALTHNIYNNTIIASDTGYSDGAIVIDAGGIVNSQNNYLLGYNCYSIRSAGTINKGSNDATANSEATTPALRSIAYSSANFTNPLYTQLTNVHIVGTALKGQGADLTAQGVTVDFEGDPRVVPFSIGADQGTDIPICWNYTARYHNSNKLFKASGCGNYPKSLRVPSNIDKSTGRMIDDGTEIDPSEYEIV